MRKKFWRSVLSTLVLLSIVGYGWATIQMMMWSSVLRTSETFYQRGE